MFEYYYHEILRKTIIAFGTLFNDIKIKKRDNSNEVFSIIKVPIAYSPTQKFLARLRQQPNLNKPVEISLPRMSFEFTGLTYDNSRKVTTTQSFIAKSSQDGTDIKKVYMPVPYNMDFELSIYSKLNDDMLQIIEQILPYFQPGYTLTVDLVNEIGEKRDIPLILNNISMQDDYEGDFSTRRSLIYTLKFTAKTYLFGPIAGADASKDIIKKVSIGYVVGESNSHLGRELTYTVTPEATKNYSDNTITTLSSDISNTDTLISVQNASSIQENSNITIDNETMRVSSKNGNTLTVIRGYYNTQQSNHVSGSEIGLIVEQDNELIEVGDDFGFSGEYS
jgi:hypothetical protein